MCISFVTKQFPDLCLHVCFFFIFICQDCMLSSKPSFNRFLFPGQLILKRCSDVSILPNNLIAQTIMGISKTQKPTSAVCLSLTVPTGTEDKTLFCSPGLSSIPHHQPYHKTCPTSGKLTRERYKGSPALSPQCRVTLNLFQFWKLAWILMSSS